MLIMRKMNAINMHSWTYLIIHVPAYMEERTGKHFSKFGGGRWG